MNASPILNRSGRAVLILLASGLTIVHSGAQIPMAFDGFSRAGRTELYGIGQYLSSSDINFNGPYGTVKTKMNDTGLGGFGVAYHFNDFISVHGDFMFGGATFKGDVPTLSGDTVGFSQNAFLQTGRFNVDYNIINRRLTPFLTAGVGYQYTETTLNHAPPVNNCWWDPWWGWVCYSDQPTAYQTDFTWNAGAGFRWNVLDNLIVKAMAGATWLVRRRLKRHHHAIRGRFLYRLEFLTDPINPTNPNALQLNMPTNCSLNSSHRSPKLLPLIAAMGLGLALAGCSSVKNYVDRGPVKARTFSFLNPGNRQLPSYAETGKQAHAMIQQAVIHNLAERGVKYVASGGDVTVAYLIIVGNNVSTTSLDQYFGYGEDSSALVDKVHAEQTGSKNDKRDHFEAGTLVIDLLDPKTSTLLQRRTIEAQLLRTLPMESRTTRVQSIVDQALKDLPLSS